MNLWKQVLIALLVQQVCADRIVSLAENEIEVQNFSSMVNTTKIIGNGSHREQETAARSASRRSTKSTKTKAPKQSKGIKEKSNVKTSKKSKKSKQSKNDNNVAEVQMSDCEEYCSLLSQAQNRCPYASDGHGGQEAEDCLTSCLGAAFSHDGTGQDFGLSDTIQCRMNHAKMAIKEGALTNSRHCLHATIPGPHRCSIEDAESVRYSKTLEVGKTYFYYISASLQAVGSDSSKVSQIFLLAILYLRGLRGRLYVAYPSIGISSASYNEIDCTSISSRKYRSADGTCNSLEVPSMGASQTQFIHSLKTSLPHPNGNADIPAIAKS